jgi:hypothetical protein
MFYCTDIVLQLFCCYLSGADPGFQVRGTHLKKLRRAEGGAKIFGVFRVKNHDVTPKNHIFPILGWACEIFGVFHVKNHDFTPKKIIFLPILGGARTGCPPPPRIRSCLSSILKMNLRETTLETN